MRIFLHAGHFKTGTTSFQHLLAEQKEALSDYAIYVPSFRNGNHGYRFALTRSLGKNELSLGDELRRACDAGFRYAIVSSEVASHFGPREMRGLRAIFKEFESTFVLVLRRWESFLVARYKQNIKRGDFQTLDAYFEALALHGDRHPDANFGLIIGRALECFDDVLLLPFEPDAAPKAIFRQIGIPASAIDSMLAPALPLNRSPSWSDTELYRLTNAALGAEMAWHPGRKALQGVDWAPASENFAVARFVARLKQEKPNLYSEIRASVDESMVPGELGTLEPHIRRWATGLQKAMRGDGVENGVGPDFARPNSEKILFETCKLEQFGRSAQAEIVRLHRKFLP